MYKYLEHTADIKIRVKAKEEFEFYSDIVNGVNESIFVKRVKKSTKTKILKLESNSKAQLIRDFIDELVFFANQNHFQTKLNSIIFSEKKDKYYLQANLSLGLASQKDYKIEVKAVSFNVLYKENKKTKEQVCEFILDI